MDPAELQAIREVNVIQALSIDTVTRGYLASNQLSAVLGKSRTHLEATVSTTMTLERRKFSWLWSDSDRKPLLVNRLTGTLFDPVTGQGLNSEPRILEAPIEAPEIEAIATLPAGVFSTAKE